MHEAKRIARQLAEDANTNVEPLTCSYMMIRKVGPHDDLCQSRVLRFGQEEYRVGHNGKVTPNPDTPGNRTVDIAILTGLVSLSILHQVQDSVVWPNIEPQADTTSFQ